MTKLSLPSTFIGRILFFSAVLGAVFGGVWYSLQGYRVWRASAIAAEPLGEDFERLKIVHQRLGPVQPHTWLASKFERGQTLEEYTTSNPPRPRRVEILRSEREVQGATEGSQLQPIEIIPLGSFTEGGARVLDLTAEYLGLFFCIPVVVRPPVPSNEIPESAQRRNPHEGQLQYNTRDLVHQIIAPRRDQATFLTLVLTQTDLFPLSDWNFVFGEAMPLLRTGVWSMYRFGDPDFSRADFTEVLRRTLRTASHETAHVFGLPHCIAYHCNLNGSMHLEEADSQPLEVCPSCLEKLMWNTGCDLRKRLIKLIAFTKANSLHLELDFLERELGKL